MRQRVAVLSIAISTLVVIAFLILGWALYYYFDTVSIPYDGPESVLFIKPYNSSQFLYVFSQ